MAMFGILPRTFAQYAADGTYDLTGATPIKCALIDSAAVLFPAWVASVAVAQYAVVQPTTPTGYYYQAQGAGTVSGVEPAWPTNGSPVIDGAVTWLQVMVGGDPAPTLPGWAADVVRWADVSANEISGAGYPAGGVTLTGVTLNSNALIAQLDADDVVWASATFSARYAVLYVDATRNGVVQPILGLILLDDTPADVSPAGVAFSIIFGGSGVMRLPVACELS